MNSVKSLKAASKAQAAKKGMPREAVEFAKKMGININFILSNRLQITALFVNTKVMIYSS